MDRRGTVAVLAAIAVGAAAFTPAFAAPTKPKPLKGAWSFIDTTPDPSATVDAQTKGADPYCHGGQVPAAPVDKNSYALKLKGPGTLTVLGENVLDWAMEVNDAKGHTLTASDGGLPQDKEGLVATVKKAGTYTVVFCNLGGGPTANASYTYKYR
jgi:hypothetical protein